jgi:hypothetical protein
MPESDRSRCDRNPAFRAASWRRRGASQAKPALITPGGGTVTSVKKIIELLICFLHPVAVVLIWIDLLSRHDIGAGAKLAWGIFVIVPLVPFLYVLTGGDLW